MARYKLTKADRMKGMRAAAKSRKTPAHLRKALKKKLKGY